MLLYIKSLNLTSELMGTEGCLLQDNLIFYFQVVWLSMQDEFIKQIKHYENLISECYPDSGISLAFSVADVLQFFSEIAQAH